MSVHQKAEGELEETTAARERGVVGQGYMAWITGTGIISWGEELKCSLRAVICGVSGSNMTQIHDENF